MSKLRLWGVVGVPSVYTTEEGATVLSEFLKKKSNAGVAGRVPYKQEYAVYEIFPDCYSEKIKKGYDTFMVIMDRTGKVLKYKQGEFYIPSRFGFNSGSIMDTLTPLGPPLPELTNKIPYTEIKAIHYRCLAKDKEEAFALCEKYRIKTLLDDVWFKDRNNNNPRGPGVLRQFLNTVSTNGGVP